MRRSLLALLLVLTFACSLPAAGRADSMWTVRGPASWLNRVRASGLAIASEVSSAAWFIGRGRIVSPDASHLDTMRSLTPRCVANSRTLIRRASRSARTSRPDHCGTVDMRDSFD